MKEKVRIFLPEQKVNARIEEIAQKISSDYEMCIRDRYCMCRSTLWLWKPCGAGAGAGNDNLPDAESTADLSVMEFLQNIFF